VKVKNKFEEADVNFIPVKLDYMAERSIPDNIELEST